MQLDSNFVLAVSAVVPMFCLMLIGVAVKYGRLLTGEELVHMNRMVFKVFFSIMMFYSIYTTEIATLFRPKLILFSVCAVLAVYFVAMAIICFFVKDNRRRGAMVQATFRSNFVLMGIPLVANIFSDDKIAVTTMMIAIIVPIYNVLAVFVLETFRGGRFAPVPILVGVIKNPMILGALAGAVCLLSGIHIPKPVLKPLGQITAATAPVALVILGASFRLGSIKGHARELAAVVVSRLILVPLIVMSLAACLGFRGVDFVTLISIFCTPCAVVSFAMAQQMDSDADLAGSCVVFTTALSCLTMFGWVYLFKSLGMF